MLRNKNRLIVKKKSLPRKRQAIIQRTLNKKKIKISIEIKSLKIQMTKKKYKKKKNLDFFIQS